MHAECRPRTLWHCVCASPLLLLLLLLLLVLACGPPKLTLLRCICRSGPVRGPLATARKRKEGNCWKGSNLICLGQPADRPKGTTPTLLEVSCGGGCGGGARRGGVLEPGSSAAEPESLLARVRPPDDGRCPELGAMVTGKLVAVAVAVAAVAAVVCSNPATAVKVATLTGYSNKDCTGYSQVVNNYLVLTGLGTCSRAGYRSNPWQTRTLRTCRTWSLVAPRVTPSRSTTHRPLALASP